jgi:hypothetical protein
MRYGLILLSLLTTITAHAANFSGREIFIPIVGRTAGANGTQWRSDVILTNRSEDFSTTVSLIYEPAGGEPFFQTVEMPPLATYHLTDFIGTHISLTNSFGTLLLYSQNENAAIAAHARVYNAGNAAGEFGQVVQAMPVDTLPKVAWLHGLIGFRGFRTNVGVANPSPRPIAFSISWYDKHGESHGSMGMFTVEPYGLYLFNDIFAALGVTPDEGMSVRIRSSNPLYAYASVIRNDTGDAYTIVGDGD